MVFQIPLGDLFSSGPPDVIERLGVGEKVVQRANAERLADDVRMEANVHEAAACRTLAIKPVELFLEDFECAVDILPLPHEHGEVVDLRRVGDRNDFLAGTSLDEIRL